MRIESRKIAVDGPAVISSEWAVPVGYNSGGIALLIAHGAGNDMHSPFLSYVHRSIAGRGILTVKFNFPYKERGAKAPDPADRLIGTWRAVVEAVAGDDRLSPARLVLSGKSLGGRMASMLVSEGAPADGLVFFGYPLHPPGKPEKLRSAHFGTVDCPLLFIQGTRDPLCDLGLLKREIVDRKPGSRTLHIIEGGDHSFGVLKRLDRTERSVFDEIVHTTVEWINDVIVA